jgi:transposase
MAANARGEQLFEAMGSRVAPLVPPNRRQPKACFAGIVYHLRNGMPYDCDRQRVHLASLRSHRVANHRSNRVKEPNSDGRSGRRLKRRWTIERTNAWLYSHRLAMMRFENEVHRFEGFVSLACAFIALVDLLYF